MSSKRATWKQLSCEIFRRDTGNSFFVLWRSSKLFNQILTDRRCICAKTNFDRLLQLKFTVIVPGNISARSVKPEESVKDALNTEDKKRKLQQTEIVARSESAVSAVASTPMKILKTESTFAKSFGQRGPNKEKKISFADEHGRNIADNVYVEQLHYSTASYSATELQKGCCTVS